MDKDFIQSLLKSNGNGDVSVLLIQNGGYEITDWIYGAVYGKLVTLFFYKFCRKNQIEIDSSVERAKKTLWGNSGDFATLAAMKNNMQCGLTERVNLSWDIISSFCDIFYQIVFFCLKKCDTYWNLEWFELPWDNYENGYYWFDLINLLEEEYLSLSYDYIESDYKDFIEFLDSIFQDKWNNQDIYSELMDVYLNPEDYQRHLEILKNTIEEVYDSAMAMLPNSCDFEEDLFTIQYNRFVCIDEFTVSNSFILTNTALNEYLLWRVTHQLEIRDMFAEEDDYLMDMVAMLLQMSSGWQYEQFYVKYHNNQLVVFGEAIFDNSGDDVVVFPYEPIPMAAPYIFYQIDQLLDKAKQIFRFKYEKHRKIVG